MYTPCYISRWKPATDFWSKTLESLSLCLPSFAVFSRLCSLYTSWDQSWQTRPRLIAVAQDIMLHWTSTSSKSIKMCKTSSSKKRSWARKQFEPVGNLQRFELATCPFAAAAMPVGVVETVHVRSPLKVASTAFHTMVTVKMHPLVIQMMTARMTTAHSTPNRRKLNGYLSSRWHP